MKKRNFLAALASCAVVASMFPMTVSATNYSSTIDGEKIVSIDKYLVMKTEANVPTADFEFVITAGEAIPYKEGKMEVLEGVGTPKFVVKKAEDDSVDAKDNKGTDTKAKVEFRSSDTTTPESADLGGKTINFKTTDVSTDEKFVAKTVDIDFSDVVFPEPGVYRYIITESGTTAGVTNDAQPRTLDVYVVDASADERKLAVNSYVIHTGTEAPDRNFVDSDGKYKEKFGDEEKLTDKSSGFTNHYSTQNLEFGKEVTGNQGSKDKYFKFTLTVEGAKGATLDVVTTGIDTVFHHVDTDGETKVYSTNAATVYDPQVMETANTVDGNPGLEGQQIVVGTTGTVTKDFYLNDGQYVKIVGLPKGATYTITEVEEDYKSTSGTDKVWQEADGEELAKTYSDSTTGTIENTDIHTGYTNNRTGAIPTGVILSVAAPVVIGLAVLGGIIFLVIRNKKRDAEEEE